jgi:hypothetical protein
MGPEHSHLSLAGCHSSWQKVIFFLLGASVVLGLPGPSNLQRTELTGLNYLKDWKENVESTRAHAVAFECSSKTLNLEAIHTAQLTA